MTPREAFTWGAFGSVLPEVIRFFGLAQKGDPFPGVNWIFYSISLAAFLLSAGAFTLAFQPESKYKAIWVGASLPALVATMIHSAPKSLS
jgi:hypothetical protein